MTFKEKDKHVGVFQLVLNHGKSSIGLESPMRRVGWDQGTLIHNTKIIHNTIQYVLIHNTAGQDPRMGVLFSLSLHCIFYIFYSDRAVAVTVTALRFTFSVYV